MPIFVVDNDACLLYFNEAAEGLLGERFEETGEMPLSEWGTMFAPVDSQGRPVAPGDLPLVVAVRDRHPTHGRSPFAASTESSVRCYWMARVAAS